jgi:hypothetical protein
MRRAGILAIFVAATVAAPITSCAFDPVHQSDVDALGPERSGVPRGPYHRAGQACTVCHGPEGPAEQQFVLAGTVFSSRDQSVGLDQAEILMVDSLGSSPPMSILTNCVGNFFITADTWNPAFPVRVAVASGQASSLMLGHVGRAGSCATCHKEPRGLDSPGHVFIGAMPDAQPNCPVNPVLGAP